jgi:hypothetical protein
MVFRCGPIPPSSGKHLQTRSTPAKSVTGHVDSTETNLPGFDRKLFRDQERIAYDAVAPLWKRLIGTDLLIENLSRLAGAGTAMASVPCGLGSRNTEASYQGAELRRRESPRSDRSALRDLPVSLRLLRNGRCGTAASTPGSQCPKPPQNADSVIHRTPTKACAGRC